MARGFNPLRVHHLLLQGRSSPDSVYVSVHPLSTRTYSNSSSSNSWCLSPATTSSHLLSSCCHKRSRVSQGCYQRQIYSSYLSKPRELS